VHLSVAGRLLAIIIIYAGAMWFKEVQKGQEKVGKSDK
jgi:hypothetical protein